MNTINKRTELFSKFPGIGPRQSKRFIYFLLTRNNGFLEELSRLISRLKKEVIVCDECKRFFANSSNFNICNICSDKNRNDELLMVVERDADFENIERSGAYEGKYFVLGGRAPILEKNPEFYIKKLLSPITEKHLIKISILGRGLSTGIELEYPDSETLKNAIKNRM